MSTNDNSINARFCWQTCIRSRVISILSATPTDCLKNKVCLWICFPRKIFFPTIFDFHFRENPRFRDEFQALMFVSCVCKRRWWLGGRSAVKCRKAIFAYVAKRKSSSRTLCTCWSRIFKKKKKKKKKEILILKVWFYGNSVKLQQSPTHAILFAIKSVLFCHTLDKISHWCHWTTWKVLCNQRTHNLLSVGMSIG